MGIDRAKAAGHFSGWLATIIKNDCLNALAAIEHGKKGNYADL
jgi:hypothetical protein